MTYDRRAAVNRLTPLAEMAAKDFHEGLTKIESALKLVKLIEKEAQAQIPKNYQPSWISGPQQGREFAAVAKLAKDINTDVDRMRVAEELRQVANWLTDLATETKAWMGE